MSLFIWKDHSTGHCIPRMVQRGPTCKSQQGFSVPLSIFYNLPLLSQEMRFIMIKCKMMLIFWSFKESRVNTKLLRICSTNLGLDTGESLVSILPDTKEVCGSAQLEQTGMWCVSVISCLPPTPFFSAEIGPLVKRHLCFLLSFQDWMSWFRTHKCNFNFDCLLVYFMHLLLEEGEMGFLRGYFEARADIWPDISHRNMENKSTCSTWVI